MLRLCPRKSSGMPNAFALLISAISLTIIFGSFDPAPAGEDLSSVDVLPPAPVEVPPPVDAIADSPSADNAVISGSSADGAHAAVQAAPAKASGSMVLDNHDTLKFSLLMLQDGCRFIENVSSYSTLFSKQERIQGDLGEVQNIEMKVMHAPHFSIYMKWKNGDTGRQLLFNDTYEDKKMVVKLGGLKGRLLPAIKLDPSSPEAMSQARYPVTEAGVHGMLKQLVYYRQADLKSGEGIRCVRLENTVFDERDCYCFLYEYAAPKYNSTYRKSLLLLDARYHIPLRIINHTWTDAAEGISAAELDAQTLIEDYSFSRVDFGTQLVGEDFSRDNPKYRM